MKRKQSLFESLKLYIEKGIYPLHMPGHKRRMSFPGFFAEGSFPDTIVKKESENSAGQDFLTGDSKPAVGLSGFPGNPIAFDFTEVEGTDDLHHPEGILLDSMKRAARVFGADETRYLVNGSTSGNLIGISAICPLNGELIVARNCHRSVFHALELRNITAHFVYPDFDSDFGIFGGVSPEDVEKLFIEYPDSKGVVITSPTYEGVVSDIRGIAEICHRHGAVLYVDEAHGAHFGLVEVAGFPENAVQCGADISVQSAHKTLIGLTQTAFLHIRKGLVDEAKVDRFIDIFETSSPSYPLMLSLDACTEMVLCEGEKVFGDWAETLRLFDERIKNLRYFRVLCHGADDIRNHGFFGFDKSKLLVNCGNTHLNGEKFMEIMRERFGFELEMQLSQNALAMTGPGDDREQILRFASAILILDREEEAVRSGSGNMGKATDIGMDYIGLMSMELQQTLTIQHAALAESEFAEISDAAGRISSEYVYCYPPGVPLVVPGETLDKKCVEGLLGLMEKGYSLRFTKSELCPEVIACIKDDKK